MSNSKLAMKPPEPEYCLLWVDSLCASLDQWPGWLQVLVGVAGIIAAILFAIWQQSRSNATKRKNIHPILLTAAHYIDKACAYAETDDREAKLDITIEKLQRVYADINDMKPFDSPDAAVAEAVNLFRIALSRALSGLTQWLESSNQQSARWGLEDLQDARKVSGRALALLGINPPGERSR